MSKKNKTSLEIFIESIGLYFSNFDKFVKYMTFPVLGQVGGLLLVFLLSFFYAKTMPNIIQKFEVFNNFTLLVICAILIALPGLVIFVKAFWEYLVAYGAVNSMLENMLKSGKVYDFDAHTELIKRRTIPFVGLWLLFGLFSLLAVCPLLWVPAGVFAVFFVLIFQVFTYEPELSPIGCAKRSLELVKGHFASTFLLMALVGALTYILIPEIINTFFEVTKITEFCTKLTVPFIQALPIQELNSILTNYGLKPLDINALAMLAVTTTIAQIFIQYTLPLRSILFGMWYKELVGSLPKQVEKKRSSKSKKPSEKLMEESHKKFAKKKIDKNILKRAMEKDEE